MWPFKPRQLDINTLPSLSGDGCRWGVAEARYDSSPLIVRFNETARDWAGHSALPIKLGFAVPLNAPSAGGLPGPEENAQLNEVEDILVAKLAALPRVLHALVLTTGVIREFIFYVPAGVDIKQLHESIQFAVKTHEVQCVATMEPKWDSYRQFTPG